MKLSGKVAIVTGSGQGIGRSIAVRLAGEGATVVINDVNEPAMSQVVGEIKDAGGAAFPLKADVSNRAEVQKSFKSVAENHGGIHVLVNNAFLRRNAPIMDVTEEDWDIVLGIGLKGVFFCIQAAAKYMMEQHYGKIVNMSSMAALGSFSADHFTYAAAKSGVIAVTKVAAKALGPHGVNVNCIAPGVIVTPSQLARRGKEGAEAFFDSKRKSTVLGRVGQTEDIANLAFFLASDESSYITGQVIACEGGRTDLMLA